ncbi:hypothetical protein [Nonomuraea insulae]|uniref:Uncharacterized protein n=1 Tax=Nonomuraea insulae TaxID=1616787 RepID=A0ABW1CW93_9ACTN
MAAPKGRKLTADETYALVESLSPEQMRNALHYLKGWDEEGFQFAVQQMGGGG